MLGLICELDSQGGSDVETAHSNVAKWTRRIDVFAKKFLFVPICEDMHWTLAIICNPAGIKDIDNLTINLAKSQDPNALGILYMDSMGGFKKKALVLLTGTPSAAHPGTTTAALGRFPYLCTNVTKRF